MAEAKSEPKVHKSLVDAVRDNPDAKVYKVTQGDKTYHATAPSLQAAMVAVAESLGFKVELVGLKSKYAASIAAMAPPKDLPTK